MSGTGLDELLELQASGEPLRDLMLINDCARACEPSACVGEEKEVVLRLASELAGRASWSPDYRVACV